MSIVVVDDPVQNELEVLTEPVELWNRQGRLLGRFVPALTGRHFRRPSDNCPYSDEELDAMYNDKTRGRTLDEIQQDWMHT